MSSLKIGLMEIFKKSSQSPLLRGSNSKFPLDKGGKGDFQAFTLVEIIIIVVILAILGLISFISIQLYFQETRDAKRISDVRSLISKITIEQTKGTSLEQLMDIEEYKVNNLTINGKPNVEGYQGIINFLTLKEPANSFKDPKSNHDYPFAYSYGTTTINGKDENYNFVQMAYVNEKDGSTKLVGNYYKMEEKDSPSLFTDEYKDFIENNGEPIYDGIQEPKDCEPQITQEGYELSEGILYKTSKTLTKPGSEIEHGTITMEQDYYCNKGTLEKTGDERTIVNCANEPNQEYIPNGNACVASLCQGTLPANINQNGQQTNSKIWHYNETPEQCAFKCISGYTYEIETNTCKQDCSGTGEGINENGYKLSYTKHNETTPNLEKANPILGGTQTKQTTYTCNNGTFTQNTETVINVVCETNYTANEETKTCEANTQTFTCEDKPEIGTIWNMGSNNGSYTQTWNGTAWIPTDTTTAYNTTSSSTACSYICAENYTRYSNACNQNCPATTNNGYTLPATNGGETTATLSKNVDITGGTQTKQTTYTCNNGTFTQNTETVINVVCETNYTANEETKTCEANTQTFTCEDKPEIGTIWNMGSNNGSYTQTWNGTAWIPTDTTTAYNTTSSSTACSYICAENYTRYSNACNQNCPATTNNGYTLPATNGGETTATLSKNVDITGGTQTKQTTYTCNNETFTQNAETVINVNCNEGYYSTDNIICIQVEAGYYSPGGTNDKTKCSAGTYSVAGAGSCTTCGINTYSGAGATSCSSCPVNSTTNGLTGRTSVSQCLGNAGYYNCEDGTCDVVGVGYFSPASSNARTACHSNSSTSGTTSSSQTQCLCNAGYYASATNTCSAVGSGYSSPALDNARYSWDNSSWGSCGNLSCTSRGSRGSCNASCGGGTQYRSCTGGSGTQTRTVQCIRSTDNIIVSDSFCTTTKPATSQTCSGNPGGSQSAICNTQTCYTYSWKTGNCSATCGAGTMSVYCRRSDGVIVDDSYCSGTRPSTSCTGGISSYSVSITSTAWTSTSNYVSPTFTTTGLTNCSWCGYSVSCNGVSPMYGVIPSSSDTSPRRDTCYFTATKTSGCTISLPSTSECNKQSSGVWNCSYPGFNASGS